MTVYENFEIMEQRELLPNYLEKLIHNQVVNITWFYILDLFFSLLMFVILLVII